MLPFGGGTVRVPFGSEGSNTMFVSFRPLLLRRIPRGPPTESGCALSGCCLLRAPKSSPKEEVVDDA